MTTSEEEDRELYIGSRDQILNRSSTTELWMRVVQKAIDDLILYRTLYKQGTKLNEEQTLYADTAYSFLFVPEYTIMVGDIEMTTEDLFSLWNIENISKWRKNLREKINNEVTKRIECQE